MVRWSTPWPRVCPWPTPRPSPAPGSGGATPSSPSCSSTSRDARGQPCTLARPPPNRRQGKDTSDLPASAVATICGVCANIVVAEDDAKQAELVRRYLEHEGHAVTVVEDGRTALETVRHQEPDLVVLDVMMPGADGLDVVRILRAERREVPVLMLTARSTEDDLLLGLDLGADDYMTKPFSPRELTARVRTLLRRSRRTTADSRLRVGDLVIDPVRHEVSRNGVPIECTPGEFRL